MTLDTRAPPLSLVYVEKIREPGDKAHTCVCTQLLVLGAFNAVPQVGVNDIHIFIYTLTTVVFACTIYTVM